MAEKEAAGPWNAVLRYRKPVYIVLGILAFLMVAMSFVEFWVLNNAPDVSSYGSIAASANGFPPADQKGAYLLLNEGHDPQYAGNLVALLSLSEPGVVSDTQGAHLLSKELKGVLVQADVVGDGSEYRIYRIGDPVVDPLNYERQPGGKDMIIKPQSGIWKAGAYVVDIPSAGMFGGRDYFQFYIDPDK